MIKIFVNDSKVGGEMYEDSFNLISNNEHLDINAKSEKKIFEIPRGYDVYLIHLRDIVDKGDIFRLREEQPFSEIHYLFAGGDTPFGIKEHCDGVHTIVTSRNLREILDNSKIKLGMGASK
jgi:hypothetical protein